MHHSTSTETATTNSHTQQHQQQQHTRNNHPRKNVWDFWECGASSCLVVVPSPLPYDYQQEKKQKQEPFQQCGLIFALPRPSDALRRRHAANKWGHQGAERTIDEKRNDVEEVGLELEFHDENTSPRPFQLNDPYPFNRN